MEVPYRGSRPLQTQLADPAEYIGRPSSWLQDRGTLDEMGHAFAKQVEVIQDIREFIAVGARKLLKGRDRDEKERAEKADQAKRDEEVPPRPPCARARWPPSTSKWCPMMQSSFPHGSLQQTYQFRAAFRRVCQLRSRRNNRRALTG
jgi:hypothetical protein